MSERKMLSVIVIRNNREAAMVETLDRLHGLSEDAIEIITANDLKSILSGAQGEYIYLVKGGDLIDNGAFEQVLKILSEKGPDIIFVGGRRAAPYTDALTGNNISYRREPDIEDLLKGMDILPLLLDDGMSVDKFLFGRSFIKKDILTGVISGQEYEKLIILESLLASSRACFTSGDVHIMREIGTVDTAEKVRRALDEYDDLKRICIEKELRGDALSAAGKISSRIINDIRSGYRFLPEDQKELLKDDVRSFDISEMIEKPVELSSEMFRAKAEKLSEKQDADKIRSQVKDLNKKIEKLQKEMKDIKGSVSFKTGRFLTLPLRKIRDLIRRK